jgi:hypothetical protein
MRQKTDKRAGKVSGWMEQPRVDLFLGLELGNCSVAGFDKPVVLRFGRGHRGWYMPGARRTTQHVDPIVGVRSMGRLPQEVGAQPVFFRVDEGRGTFSCMHWCVTRKQLHAIDNAFRKEYSCVYGQAEKNGKQIVGFTFVLTAWLNKVAGESR